ncbi:patatin-like phospholipase family protein [Ruegeria halocynthiae]|uniref:patatin-like phospholipase family protein n=1 Tax=Ruegeria halocynthiae TaxID=985054 RepID=UPI00056053E0|nr:patatin-like phospholipase family protein [Ruegeria halocynthiae]
MRRIIRFAGSVALLFVVVALLYGFSILVYNHYIFDSESEMVAWPEASEFSAPRGWKTQHPKRVFVLSIEGGAMHGLAELEVLKALEEKSGKRIYEMFDFVAGASTGAIISALLLHPDSQSDEPMTANEAIDVYTDFAATVLNAPAYHTILTANGVYGPVLQNKSRITVATKLFGDGQFNDLLLPTMFPSFSQKSNGLRLFRNWDKSDANMYLRALVTAVTSAPIYFPAIKLVGNQSEEDYVSDGAMILNAPGEAAYLHARTHLPEVKDFVIISVGSRRERSIAEQTVADGGLVQWFLPLMNMVTTGESSVSAHALERHGEFESGVDVQAFFLSPHLPANSNAFDASDQNIAMIRKAGQDFVKTNDDELEKVIHILTNDGN